MLSLYQLARSVLVLSVWVGCLACHHGIDSGTPAPTAASGSTQPYPANDHAPIDPIFGTYQAKTFEETSSPITYPINGQTVSLTIKPVSGDTVQVAIQSTANGKYSPGKDLIYPKAVVISKIHTDGTAIYYVYLTQPTTTDCGYNTLYIYANHTMDYNFIPPGNGPCLGARIRLGKQ
jgi:hypothetical protein